MAEELRADFVLLDELRARRAAIDRGLPVIGTLAVVEQAADKGLLELAEAIGRLKQTSFHASASLFDALLEREAERQGRNYSS